MGHGIAYLMLFLTIIVNIIGTSLLNASDGLTRPLQSVSGVILCIGSYFFLSVTILYMNVSIAYAIFAGVGILLSSVISWIIFRQPLTKRGIFFAAVIIIGVAYIRIFGTI